MAKLFKNYKNINGKLKKERAKRKKIRRTDGQNPYRIDESSQKKNKN